MITKPIEQANDPDLRASAAAMQRAAQRARQVAASTGTHLVLAYNGRWRLVAPSLDQAKEQ